MSNVRITIGVFLLIAVFAIGYLFGMYGCARTNQFQWLSPLLFSSTRNIVTSSKSSQWILFEGYNGTHLWSWRLADEQHYRLARSIPCRNVSYTGGPKIDQVDSCDNSSNNEFSRHNTIQAQKWLFEHQNPTNCSGKRFAIIEQYAWSGFGSVAHQVVWAFGMALADDRIAVYRKPGNWIYTDCPLGNFDCTFLPISNCSAPTTVDGNQTITIKADLGHWSKPVHPPIFQNRTFNWYRAQLLFYLIRFKPEIVNHVQNAVAQYFSPPSIEAHRPFIALYIRRSDKVQFHEMSQAYNLRQYFDLFDAHIRQANISTIYINSEDEHVFKEFEQLNKDMKNYYKLLSIKASRNVVFRTLVHFSKEKRAQITREFLTDLYIEAHADVHAGTLTSNWCRLVDEMRLVLGKTIPYYTPENRYLMDMRR